MNIDLLTWNASIKRLHYLVYSPTFDNTSFGMSHTAPCLNLYFCCNAIFMKIVTQPASIGPQDVPRTSPSNVPRTSPKDPIWPSRGRPNIMSWGHPNLTFKGRPWEVDSRRPQDFLRTSLRGSSEYSNLDAPVFFVTFLSGVIRLTKSI